MQRHRAVFVIQVDEEIWKIRINGMKWERLALTVRVLTCVVPPYHQVVCLFPQILAVQQVAAERCLLLECHVYLDGEGKESTWLIKLDSTIQ